MGKGSKVTNVCVSKHARLLRLVDLLKLLELRVNEMICIEVDAIPNLGRE